MNGNTIDDDIARARALGLRPPLLFYAADRLTDPLPAGWPILAPHPVDSHGRRPELACPTCDDGIRTIESPVRCRECVRAGL